MSPSYGFVGVVCAVYLLGGFLMGGLVMALQTVVYQIAKSPWVKILPLIVGLFMWLAMIYYRFVGFNGPFGAVVSGWYTVFGGCVRPHDLLAFALSTIPIMVGLVIGVVVSRRNT